MQQESVGESAAEHQIEDIVETQEVKSRSVKGMMALLARTGFLQVVAVGATLALTIFLEPAEFGVFAIIAAAVDILVYFSDIGLAGALIQKHSISNDDLKTTFTTQQFLSAGLVIVGFMATDIVGRTYHLSPSGIWLFRALLVSFFLSNLKTIPSILLERKLEFGKLVIPQILETVSFYTVAVVLAWRGFGVESFTWAILIRSGLGLVVIYLISPWRPILGFNAKSLKSLASFGAPFQLNSLLGLFKDRLLVVYYGAVLPATQIGYLQWGERWALFPLRLVVDNVGKVTFPAYSRLQKDKESLTKAIEKSLFFTTLVIFPILVGMVVLAPNVVQIIPKYQKWQPALVALMFFAVNGMWSSISTTLTNAFAAMGKISINLKLMVMWTMLTWVATPLLLVKFGYVGVAAASAIVATTSIVPMIIMKRILPIRLVSNILPQMVSALFMGLIIRLISLRFTFYDLRFTIYLFAGAILYFTFLFLLTGNRLVREIRSIRRLAISSQSNEQ